MKVVLSLILLLLSGTAVNAANETALDKLTHKIDQLKHFLSEKQSTQNNLQDELSTIEQQINQVNRQLYRVEQKVKTQQKKLNPLQDQQYQLQANLDKQRAALANQLQVAYQMGQQTSLQLFLSQQEPSDVTRMASYYQALNQARQKLIEQFLQSLAAVQDNQAKINQVVAEMEQLRSKQQSEQAALKQKVSNRKDLLTKVKQQISTSQQRIAQLEANKRQLQSVVDNLNVQKQYANLSGKSFASLKHRLPWPVVGRITRHFGDLYDGRLRSNGVFLSAPNNAPVRTIAAGQVIFANWLRGYGNMIIVSHSGGYMTLYGHNNAILVQVGDMVKAGEEIGLVGNSGGLLDSGLYFEIRYKGKTSNPATWCQ